MRLTEPLEDVLQTVGELEPLVAHRRLVLELALLQDVLDAHGGRCRLGWEGGREGRGGDGRRACDSSSSCATATAAITSASSSAVSGRARESSSRSLDLAVERRRRPPHVAASCSTSRRSSAMRAVQFSRSAYARCAATIIPEVGGGALAAASAAAVTALHVVEPLEPPLLDLAAHRRCPRCRRRAAPCRGSPSRAASPARGPAVDGSPSPSGRPPASPSARRGRPQVDALVAQADLAPVSWPDLALQAATARARGELGLLRRRAPLPRGRSRPADLGLLRAAAADAVLDGAAPFCGLRAAPRPARPRERAGG